MIAYLDTLALLRLVLDEPGRLDQLRACEGLVSSELLRVEALRTLDRLRLQGALAPTALDEKRAAVLQWLEVIDILPLQARILAQAAVALPVPLGTLDALHLATALAWREHTRRPLVIATHDAALARAARVFGLETLGV